MYYLLLYDVVADYIERRGPLREQHLGLIRAAQERGELVMAGAYADPIDGAALLFRADDPSVAERFAQRDPYVQHGLVANWRVRRWVVVTGDGESNPTVAGTARRSE